MKKLRIPFLVFMTISFVLPPTAGSAEPPQAPKALILPLTGVGTDGVTFNGTVAVQRFVQRNGQVFAIGAVSGSLSGPTGYAGLAVRQWTCSACGAVHDRDVNAAINTLIAGVGITLECRRKAVPGIPWL